MRAEGGNGTAALTCYRDVLLSVWTRVQGGLCTEPKGLCLVAGPTGPVWGCSVHMGPSDLPQGFPPQGRVAPAEGSTLGGILDTIQGAMRWPLGWRRPGSRALNELPQSKQGFDPTAVRWGFSGFCGRILPLASRRRSVCPAPPCLLQVRGESHQEWGWGRMSPSSVHLTASA